ncbi:GNAT family N-acetyltransferase [Actinoplanes solisilvae]|uniref:GNAT family N-acetyltransferase n=1 Tax=Actinoplanes solisilvae TaxID=2486853 RepID=UPI000FD9BDEE|nr:GNAT family N-acetyltransferase [Actinoplanes solisilvae]
MEAVESKNELIAVWTRLIEDRGGVPAAGEGVSYLWAGSTFPFWNTLTLTGEDIPAEDLSEQLVRAASFMRGRDQGGYLWLFEDLLSPRAKEELERRLEEAGLEIAFSGAGMAGELSLSEPQHPGLVFRRVETEDDLETYGEINALAYDMPTRVGRDALAGSKLWLDEAYAFIGYRDGEPVTCAASIASTGSLFLALVATLPGHRDNGFGEAVSRKAIFEGARATGRGRVVLHATAEGRPVYERLGLTANTPIHFVQPAGALDEVGD